MSCFIQLKGRIGSLCVEAMLTLGMNGKLRIKSALRCLELCIAALLNALYSVLPNLINPNARSVARLCELQHTVSAHWLFLH